MNVNSLMNKVNYVSMLAGDCYLDVVAISESWLVQSNASSFVAVDSIVRTDVQGLVRKHCVCLYIKNTIKYVEIKVGIHKADAHLVEFDLWVLSVYNPPSYSDQENVLSSRFVCEFSQGREVAGYFG